MTDKLGDILYFDFSTHNPTTGAVQDADSIPTCEVFEDANDTPLLTPTVTKRTGKTGSYRVPVAATGGNGFSVGPSYLVWAIATVGGISDRICIGRFTLDGKRVNDLNDIAATAILSDGVAFPGASMAPVFDRMDLKLSSRAAPTDILSDGVAFRGASMATNYDRMDAKVSTRAAPTDILSDGIAYSGASLKTVFERADAKVSTRATQADILSDATPFPGAWIDDTITSRAAPIDIVSDGVAFKGASLATVFERADVKLSTRATQADILSDATPFRGASISAIDARALSILGTLDNAYEVNEAASELWLYDDAGAVVIKKWPLKDKLGGVITLGAGGIAKRNKRTL